MQIGKWNSFKIYTFRERKPLKEIDEGHHVISEKTHHDSS